MENILIKTKTFNTEFGDLTLDAFINNSVLEKYKSSYSKSSDFEKSYCELLEELVDPKSALSKDYISKLNLETRKEIGEYYVNSVDEMKEFFDKNYDESISFFENFYKMCEEYQSSVLKLKTDISLINKQLSILSSNWKTGIAPSNSIPDLSPLSNLNIGINPSDLSPLSNLNIGINPSDLLFDFSSLSNLNFDAMFKEIQSTIFNSLDKTLYGDFQNVNSFSNHLKNEMAVFQNFGQRYSEEFASLSRFLQNNPIILEKATTSIPLGSFNKEEMKSSVIDLFSKGFSSDVFGNPQTDDNVLDTKSQGKNKKQKIFELARLTLLIIAGLVAGDVAPIIDIHDLIKFETEIINIYENPETDVKLEELKKDIQELQKLQETNNETNEK